MNRVDTTSKRALSRWEPQRPAALMEAFRNVFNRKRRAQVAFWNLVEQAEDHLRRLDAANEAAWGLGSARRLLDDQSGSVRFERSEGSALSANAQIIGSLSPGRPVWRWAWDNPGVPPALARSAEQARAYGVAQNLERLVTPAFACTLVEAWGLAALACLLSGAQGAWCEQTPQGLVFMVFDAPRLPGLDLDAVQPAPPIALGYEGS